MPPIRLAQVQLAAQMPPIQLAQVQLGRPDAANPTGSGTTRPARERSALRRLLGLSTSLYVLVEDIANQVRASDVHEAGPLPLHLLNLGVQRLEKIPRDPDEHVVPLPLCGPATLLGLRRHSATLARNMPRSTNHIYAVD